MPKKSRKNVGLIGLGIIGSRVPNALRTAGFHVYVWNRTPRAAPNFLASARQVAELCDIIQIFVSDAQALFDVLDGMGDALTSSHIILCNSTVGPEATLDAARIVQDRGAQFLDAPFTGSKGAADKRELVYYIGGDDKVLQVAEPVLKASSKSIVKIGKIGDAAIVKVATNMISAVTVQTLAEAYAIVKGSGIDPKTLGEALKHHALRSGITETKFPKMLAKDYDPHFSLKHMFKDVQLGIHIANSLDIDLPATTSTAGVMYGGLTRGWADQDFSVLARNYQKEDEPPPLYTPPAAKAPEKLAALPPAPEATALPEPAPAAAPAPAITPAAVEVPALASAPAASVITLPASTPAPIPAPAPAIAAAAAADPAPIAAPAVPAATETPAVAAAPAPVDTSTPAPAAIEEPAPAPAPIAASVPESPKDAPAPAPPSIEKREVPRDPTPNELRDVGIKLPDTAPQPSNDLPPILELDPSYVRPSEPLPKPVVPSPLFPTFEAGKTEVPGGTPKSDTEVSKADAAPVKNPEAVPAQNAEPALAAQKTAEGDAKKIEAAPGESTGEKKPENIDRPDEPKGANGEPARPHTPFVRIRRWFGTGSPN